MRAIALAMAAASMLAACANDVVMRDPRTGQSAVCRQSLSGLDPWSQTDGCVAAHAEQGWRIIGEPY